MNYGLERLKTLPLGLRLIREIHDKLLAGVRGSNRTPGEFRTSQNWIGPNECTQTQRLCLLLFPKCKLPWPIWKTSYTTTRYRY